MSTQPFTSSRFRALDSNGAPLAGGLLYTYAAGTTTPLATYTDYVGGTPNANPVVLDSTGEADVWLQAGVLYKFVLQNSLGVIQYTTDNFPSPAAATPSTDNAATEPGGRLTLTAGTPVTVGAVTSATTVYYVPYKSDKVPLYDGTNWTLNSIGSSGVSQTTTDTTKSPLAVSANSNYDLFVWSDSGTIRVSRGPAWTSDTGRGSGAGTTELQQVNGRYVNKNSITNGPAASRGLYVGTVRSDGSAQLNDSTTKRHVWNNNNRIHRSMRAVDATASWVYNTSTWRQANANVANQISMVIGLSENAVSARTLHYAFSNGGAATTAFAATGIGLDSTTAPDTSCLTTIFAVPANGGTTPQGSGSSSWEGLPGLGYHYLSWLEYGSTPLSAGSLFFTGTSTPIQTGIHGEILA